MANKRIHDLDDTATTLDSGAYFAVDSDSYTAAKKFAADKLPDPTGATDGYVWTADGADGAAWEAVSGGAGDVTDLTTTTGSSTNMVRVAAAGGLEYRTVAQVLSDIGALAATGATTGATSSAQTFTNGIDTVNGKIYTNSTRIFYSNVANDRYFWKGGNEATTGTNLIAIGTVANGQNTTGVNNFSFGYGTNYGVTTGNNNVAIGTFANFNGNTSNKVSIGNNSGHSGGSGGVYLGDSAGYYETESNKLFIDFTSRSNEANGRVSALIYGEFNTTVSDQLLRINGQTECRISSAVTNSILNATTIKHNTSGTPAVGFGSAIDFNLESTTTEDQDAARIATQWQTATHASRAADLILYASDYAAEREGVRVRANGSAAAIGFLGATPAVQQTGGAATAGGTWSATEQAMLQAAYDALRTFGLLS